MSRFLQSSWFVVAAYFLFGSIWILVSDLAEEFLPLKMGIWYQTGKGLLFVASTTLLIFLILSKQQKRIRRALQEARRSSRTKSDYLIVSSHELRTPLNVMEGLLTLLEKNPSTEERNHYQALLRIAYQSLHQTVNSVLELEEGKAGKIEVSKTESFDAVDMIHQCVETYKQAFQGKSFSYQLPHHCNVYGDSSRFQQSVMQILSNAVKFTPDSGKILIRGEVENDSICISFRDNGPGIPAERLRYIFKEFNQSGNVLRRSHRGVGVGLALVRFFIENMGGRIKAIDTQGAGTHIKIYLPISQEKAARTVKQAPLGPPRPLHILVVDDDPLSLLVEQRMLCGAGHTVEKVQDGAEALKTIIQKHDDFDVVFMDVIMPVMDGLQATRAIRHHEKQMKLKPLKIVIVSANAFESDLSDGYAAGADDYLVKPVTVEQMLVSAADST